MKAKADTEESKQKDKEPFDPVEEQWDRPRYLIPQRPREVEQINWRTFGLNVKESPIRGG
jgi:hypothetical protein